MSWTDLFKSKKGSGVKPDPTLRWFGKLPTYADYYQSRVDADWANEFNDWILKGFELFYSRWHAVRASAGQSGGRALQLPLSGAVVRLPKSGMTVFTSIQDYGGDMRGRHFPLCFYVAIPTASWPGPTSEQMAGASRIVTRLMNLRDDVLRFFRAPGRFEEAFGDREIDLEDLVSPDSADAWRRDSGKLGLAEWFGTVEPDISPGLAKAWLDRAGKWGEDIRRNDGKDFEPTLRFPLVMDRFPEAQVIGWVRWLEDRMDLSERCLSLMMTGGTGRVGTLSVIARELLTDDFLLLTPLSGTLNYVDDLATVAKRDLGIAANNGDGRGEDLPVAQPVGAPASDNGRAIANPEGSETASDDEVAGSPAADTDSIGGVWADFVESRPENA